MYRKICLKNLPPRKEHVQKEKGAVVKQNDVVAEKYAK